MKLLGEWYKVQADWTKNQLRGDFDLSRRENPGKTMMPILHWLCADPTKLIIKASLSDCSLTQWLTADLSKNSIQKRKLKSVSVVAGPEHFVCQMDCLRVHVTVAIDRMLPHLWIITNRWCIWQAPKEVFLQYMNLIQVSVFRLYLLEYFGDGYSIF